MSKERQDLLLREFDPQPALVTEDNTPERARFPVIDAHTHIGAWNWDSPIGMPMTPSDEWPIEDLEATLAMWDQINVRSVVNLDGGWGDALLREIEHYKEPYPDRFFIYAWVDWSEVSQVSNFGEKWARELERAVAAGAQGLKVFKSLGLVYRDESGQLIMPDDERLDPVWAMAGELGIPVVIHSADPVAFFDPLDRYNERWEELYEHPDWHFYGDEYPSFITPIEAQLRVVEKHPRTTFQSAHIMSYAENLDYVARALDRYPNLNVDITERISELGRQPYSAREFLITYADRVLFGSDAVVPDPDFYRTQFRFLETDDEYFEYGPRNQGNWRIYGVYLPDDVLRKIYYENALRLIPGTEGIDFETS